MKTNIKITFKKIGNYEITPQLIAKEKNLIPTTYSLLTKIGNQIADLFEKKRIRISSVICSVEDNDETELIGEIDFEVQKILNLEINKGTINSLMVKSFRKDVQNLMKRIQGFFKYKRIVAEIEVNVK
jgi:hypothetical protein